MNATKKSPLQNLIELASYEARSYSGRAMYGKECIAVDLEGTSPFEFFADLLRYAEEDSDRECLEEALRSAKTDSMGRGQVVYFPDTEYFDEDQEGTEGDDPEG